MRELQAAAGSGALDLDETVTGYVYFRADWLRRHQLDPSRCSVIGVMGESMEPTLTEGCSILLDHQSQELRDGRIFVVRTSSGVVVKRIGKDSVGGRLLLSDHAAWEPEPLPADALVIGEVRWMGRVFR